MKKFVKYDIKFEELQVNNDQNHAKIKISPLERGFGITLGNALRRVCLSNVPGASMFAIKIPGITHEYQGIDGVNEDVTKIILNLKNLVISIDENVYSYEELSATPIERFPTLKISKDKKGPILASDIEVPPGFTIINKDLHIATLNKDVKFNLEIYATLGRGFKPFSANKEGINALSIIVTDSNFSPVTNFSYHVEEVKDSKFSVSDELTIEIATNGAIKAVDALALASKILTDHFDPFLSLNDKYREAITLKEKEIETKKANLSIPIEDLNLSVRAFNALKNIQVNTTQELIEKTRKEIDEIRNLGKKSVQEIIKVIHDRGLKLKGE